MRRFLPRPRKWKYYLMVLVVSTIGRMPLGWRYGISRVVSDRVYDWRRSIRRNVQSNVRHVLGPDATDEEIDRVGRACARNAGRYYADVVGMHRMNVRMVDAAIDTITEVDVLCLVVDATEPGGKGDQFVMDLVKKAKQPGVV